MEATEALPLRLSHGAVTTASGALVLDALPATSFATDDAAAAPHGGLLLGFRSGTGGPASLLDLPLGLLRANRMLACARCKLWWMTPEWRTSTLQLPPETQFLLVELPWTAPHGSGSAVTGQGARSAGAGSAGQGLTAGAGGGAGAGRPEGQPAYALLLPLIDGDFRATLRAGSKGSPEGSVVLRIESGDRRVSAESWSKILYVAAGTDPFKLIDAGVAAAAQLSGTSLPRVQKQLPASLDVFGWCTWDAFYSSVSAKGVMEGLRSLSRGGVRARMLIIDDGWQSTDVDPEYRKPADATATATATTSSNNSNSTPAPASSSSPVAPGAGAGNGNTTSNTSNTSNTASNTSLAWLSQASDRLRGWLMGAGTALFLLYYQGVVEPAAPDSWAVRSFAQLARGMLRPSLLSFFADASDFTRRLTSVCANAKFSHPGAGPGEVAAALQGNAPGLGSTVAAIKKQFGVDYVYCWHGLPAYWSGVMPGAPEMEQYHPTLMYGDATPGVLEVEPSMAWNPAALAGVGVIAEPDRLYNAMHGYLSSCGVDGVKVDCQAGLGLVGSSLGGGAAVAKKFHAALEQSVERHFPGNHCINCMCHSTENIYRMAHTSVARASDDFYPRNAASSTPHIAACAFNGLFMSALVQPDWDMFHSRHASAELHAMARAISGGAVYVSDKPAEHDFELLRRLVLPDGSVLRASQPARPTRDCLFRDVLRDGTSLLKLWTKNAYTGVVGVFHLQGSSWDRNQRKFAIHDKAPKPLSTQVLVQDVEGLGQAPLYALYAFARQELITRSWVDDPFLVSQGAGSSELITVSPAVQVGSGTLFAPIGLYRMYNGGAAVLSCTVTTACPAPDSAPASNAAAARLGMPASVWLRVRGCGSFLAYCSTAPSGVVVEGALPLFFDYDSHSGALRLDVPATKDLRCTLTIKF